MIRKHLKSLLLAVLLLPAICAWSQSTAVTSVGSLNIVKEVKPPILQVQGQIVFSEPSGNRAIDANEHCSLRLTVKNTGMGDGYGLKGKIRAKNQTPGIMVNDVTVPTIKVGQTQTVEFPIAANMNTVDGTAEFVVSIDEPNGFGTTEYPVSIPVRAFVAPMVEFRGHIVESGAAVLSKMNVFRLQVLVQNTGRGDAEQVNASLQLPDNVLQVGQEGSLVNATLKSGESRTLTYSLIINQNYASHTLPITVALSERYGKYSQNGTINLEVADGNEAVAVVVSANEGPARPVVVASLGSDVDENIPVAKSANDNMHVMIVANQHYANEAEVGTALNDARMVREYCIKTLGVPDKQVQICENQTFAQLQTDVENFARTIRVNSGDRFLFFYFGHGMHSANPQVSDAYLIPVDGSSLRLQQTGVSRNWMMQQFQNAKPGQLVVYLESCFSGAQSDDQMLAYAEGSSGLRVSDDVTSNFSGNIILLTASSQSETANAYPAQRHNVFTYEFLKALQTNKGDQTWGGIFDDVKRNTTRTAWNELGRTQTPSITVSSTLGDGWRKWRVR